MSVCKNCGAANVDEAAFCTTCGKPIEPPVCPRCKVRVADGMRFCGKCGMPLDGSAVCGVCGMIIAPDANACPRCGMRADGKRVCPACGTVMERDNAFCSVCGAAMPGGALAPVSPAHGSRPDASGNAGRGAFKGVSKEKLVPLIRTGGAFVLMFVLFMLSFFSIFTMQIPGSVAELPGNIKVDVTGVDLMAVPFRLINPPSAEESLADFQEYVEKHMKLSGITESQAITEVERLIKNYGVLHLSITEESLANAPMQKVHLLLWGLLGWAYLGVTLGFSVALLISGIKQLLGLPVKGRRKEVLGFAVLFGLVLIAPMLLGSSLTLGGSAIAMLVFGGLALAGLTVSRYVFEGAKFDPKIFVPRAVSFVAAIVVTACFAGAAVHIRAVSDKSVLEVNTTVTDQIAANDSEAQDDVNLKDFYDKAFPALFVSENGSLSVRRDALAAYFNPNALFKFAETTPFRVSGTVVNVLLLLANLASAGMLAVVTLTSLTDIAEADGKKRRLGWHIGAAAGGAGLIVFSGVLAGFANSVAGQLNLSLTYGVGAGLIVGMVFAVGSMVQRLVTNTLFAPKQPAPAYAFGPANSTAAYVPPVSAASVSFASAKPIIGAENPEPPTADPTESVLSASAESAAATEPDRKAEEQEPSAPNPSDKI